MNIGKKIRLFALNKYGSLTAFAKAMNMSPSNINFYITERRKPGADIIYKLKNLGCDINWLFSEENEGSKNWEAEVQYKDEIKEKIRAIKETLKEIENILDNRK